MHDNKPDQFVDELLEASLKQYRAEEPRAGLEMRVLAGVRSRQGAVRRRRLVWALAACAGTLAAIVLALHSARAPRREPVISSSAPRQTAKTAASPGSADSRLWSPRLVQGPREKPRTPKPVVRAAKRPEQFPTPMPLTEQEKLLLVYLSRVGKPDQSAKDDKEGAPITDLEISTIQIAPLEIKALDDSQSESGK